MNKALILNQATLTTMRNILVWFYGLQVFHLNMVLVLMMVLIFISMVLVLIMVLIFKMVLVLLVLSGIGLASLEHAINLKDSVGDLGLHCNDVPSKSKDNFLKFGNPKLATLDSKFIKNLNLGLSPQKILRNTLLSKSSILNNAYEPFLKPI